MMTHYAAGPKAVLAQAAEAAHRAERAGTTQVLPVHRPASDNAADLPPDPFVRRPRLRGRGSRRLSGRPAVFVLASLVIFATAAGVPALLGARVVQGLSTGAAPGAIGAAMLDMDRELGTFANAVAPGMGSASGAILSALAVRFLPDPTHLIYLALIGVLALQATAIAAMRETVSRAPGALASLRPEITLPRALRAPVLTAVPVLFAVWALAGL